MGKYMQHAVIEEAMSYASAIAAIAAFQCGINWLGYFFIGKMCLDVLGALLAWGKANNSGEMK